MGVCGGGVQLSHDETFLPSRGGCDGSFEDRLSIRTKRGGPRGAIKEWVVVVMMPAIQYCGSGSTCREKVE